MIMSNIIALKKLIKQLAEIRGRHTELVTVYVPAGYSMHDIAGQLRQEQSTAENIKSKPVRKNVTTALEKILRHLTLYKKTPEHGVAIFCGNISGKEGVAEIELWAVEPPEPVKTKMYWCDQRFVLEPLQEMFEEKEVYGLINLDRSEADVALLKGKKIEPLVHYESIVPGKTRAGGQSSARFSRVREGMLNDWLKEIAETANKIFAEHKEIRGILVGGPGPIKEMFLKEEYMHNEIAKQVLGTVDTSYTGEHGLEETVKRGEALIKEAAVFKEKKLLERFFTELQRPHGVAAYGFDSVLEKINMGAVDTVIITEEMPEKVREYDTGDKRVFALSTAAPKGVLIGEEDVDVFFEKAAGNFGSSVVLVSRETREGKQFYALSGIGAILRYAV